MPAAVTGVGPVCSKKDCSCYEPQFAFRFTINTVDFALTQWSYLPAYGAFPSYPYPFPSLHFLLALISHVATIYQLPI